MKNLFLLVVMAFTNLYVIAQNKIKIEDTDYTNMDVPMADQFREDGKIYVVIGIILLLFIGISIYLFLIDKKISKLEKELKNNG